MHRVRAGGAVVEEDGLEPYIGRAHRGAERQLVLRATACGESARARHAAVTRAIAAEEQVGAVHGLVLEEHASPERREEEGA